MLQSFAPWKSAMNHFGGTDRTHSHLKAINGSTFVARRAGSQQANSATPIIKAAATPNASGSNWLMSTSAMASRLEIAAPPARPMRTPIAISLPPCRRKSVMTSRRCAPWIKRGSFLLRCSHHRADIAFRADDQVLSRIPGIGPRGGHREVQPRFIGPPNQALPRVVCQADDFVLRKVCSAISGRLLRRCANADVLADGIFLRPEATGGGFTDHDDGRICLLFLRAEAAPSRDAQAERLEIIRGDEIVIRLQGMIGEQLLSGNGNWRCLPACKWRPLCSSDAFHARQRAQTLGQPVIQFVRAARLCALCAQVERERVFSDESRLDSLQLLQIARQQPGGNQQRQAHRDLCDNQRVAQT